MSRLSFRAKLLLVLFVPFLALVVVAAAGLSDRFTALHAQEQYGDLSAPLRSLDAASRALQNESVVSSWYVAGDDRAADDRAERGPCPHRRRGARLPCQRAGLRRRRAEPGRRCPARGHEQGPRRHPGDAGPGRRPRRRCRDDAQLLPRRRRATARLRRAGRSRPRERRRLRQPHPGVRARARATRARPRSERVHLGARRRRTERLQRVGRRADHGRPLPRPLHQRRDRYRARRPIKR